MLEATRVAHESLKAPPRPRTGRAAIHVHALIDSLTCGGAEVLLAELASVAPSADLRLSVGFLHDLGGSPVAERLRGEGVEPVLVGAGGVASPSSLRRVRRHLSQVGPDVVHTHLGYSDFLGGLAARTLSIPSVSTVHAADWGGSRRDRIRAALSFAGRRAWASRIIVVSEQARRLYLTRSPAVAGRLVLLPNGVGGDRVEGAGAALRAELGLSRSDRVVVMTAPLREEKGHDRAFAALDRLRDEVPGLRLLVAGDGPDRSEIERRAARLGGVVTFLGYRPDVMTLLDAADALVHTPVTDALPTGLIEAAAAGVPVIATAVGGVPEIVQHGSTGILVDPTGGAEGIAGGLRLVLDDPELRLRLGRRARRRFEARFSARDWAERLRRVYESALEER